ncbi:MAG: hypothetical protein AB1331_06515 [Bacillota bacterium]
MLPRQPSPRAYIAMVICLLLLLYIGLNGAEAGLNGLLQRNYTPSVIRLAMPAPGDYRLTLLGRTWGWHWVVPVGKIDLAPQQISVELGAWRWRGGSRYRVPGVTTNDLCELASRVQAGAAAGWQRFWTSLTDFLRELGHRFSGS